MSNPTFPNLFVIGAMRAGTSSLHEALHAHPEIYMSRFKEPQYFAPHRIRYGFWGQGNPLPEPGIDWYLRLFQDAKDVKYAGESSVSYSATHWIPDCAERIHRFNPDARLIYLLRDPVERTISHYWYFVKGHRETRGPLDAVLTHEDYTARSHYARHLSVYLERFPRENIYLLSLERLIANFQLEIRQLLSWLGVDADLPVTELPRENVGAESMTQVRPGWMWLHHWQAHWRWHKYGRMFPGYVRRWMHGLTYRTIDRDCIDLQPVIDYLRPRQREQSDELAELVGIRFPEWSTVYGDEDRDELISTYGHDKTGTSS